MLRFLIFIIFILIVGHSLEQKGESCETPKKRLGQCVNVKNCRILLNLMRTNGDDPETQKFLRASACGYEGKIPKVCCPLRIVKKISKTSVLSQRQSVNLPQMPDCGLIGATSTKTSSVRPALLGEFPWTVALGYKNRRNSETPMWLCGGTLITLKHVITAAHCVKNRRDLYIAHLGDHNLLSDNDGAKPINVAIQKTKSHPNFNSSTYANDIAIITLSQPINKSTSIRPICLPLDVEFKDNFGTKNGVLAAGWGLQGGRLLSEDLLHVTVLQIVDSARCGRAYRNSFRIDGRKVLCTSSNRDKCIMDAGGPLIGSKFLNQKHYNFLIGVASRNFNCAELGYPGIYTRITEYLNWIKENL